MEKKTRPSSFKRRKTLGDTQKSENWDVSFVPEKKRSEEGRRGVAALVVHSLEVCVFVSLCIWPFMLSAVGAQFLTFTMIYDSSVPTITPRKVFASLPAGLMVQRTVRHLNASESCWRCSYSISSTSPTRIKTTWVRFFHFQETKDHIPLCCPFLYESFFFFLKP